MPNFDPSNVVNLVGLWDFRSGAETSDTGTDDGITQNGTFIGGASASGDNAHFDGTGDRFEVDGAPGGTSAQQVAADAPFDMAQGTIEVEFTQDHHIGTSPDTVVSRGEQADAAHEGYFAVNILADCSIQVIHCVPGVTDVYLTTPPNSAHPGDLINVTYSWDELTGATLTVENLTEGTTTVETTSVNGLTMAIGDNDDENFTFGSNEYNDGHFNQDFAGSIDYVAIYEDRLPEPGEGEAVDGENFAEVMTPGYDDANAPTDSGGDIIDGADGIDDTILGNGGDDTIDAGLGDDLVSGGSGDDDIDGNAGNDTIYGDQSSAVVGDGERESFNWQGVTDTQADGSFAQDTGNVTVTYTRTQDTGTHDSTVDEHTVLNTAGIDGGDETVDNNSSLYSETNGQGNTGAFRWVFSDPVSDVEFNINDLDGDGLVTVRAFDAAGNEIPVTLTGGSDVNISGNVADAEGPYQNSNDPDTTVQVNIAGPVSRIELEHTQDDTGNSGINVTDIFFDAGGITDDSTVAGDDTIDGGEGDDLIYGDNGGVAPTTTPSTIGTVPSEGGVATLLVWDASQLSFSGGNPFPDGTGGLSDSSVSGITMTIADDQTPVGVGVQDGSSSHFNDGDTTQDLVNNEFIDGVSGSAGDRFTPEYSYSVQNTDTGEIINVYAVELNGNQVVGFVSDAPMEQGATYEFLDNTSTHPSVPYGDLATSYIIPGTTGPGVDDGGDDVITGGIGEDTMLGEGGNDTIDGGADDDLIYGDNGNSLSAGGEGVLGTTLGDGPGSTGGGYDRIDAQPVTNGNHTFSTDAFYLGNDIPVLDDANRDAITGVSFSQDGEGTDRTFGLDELTFTGAQRSFVGLVTVQDSDVSGANDQFSSSISGGFQDTTVVSSGTADFTMNDGQVFEGIRVNFVRGPDGETYMMPDDGPSPGAFNAFRAMLFNNSSGIDSFTIATGSGDDAGINPIEGNWADGQFFEVTEGDGGDDVIEGGEGEDTMFGEGGDDTFVVGSAAEGAGDVIDGGNGPDETTDNDVLDLRGAGPVTIADAADANDDGATAGTVTFGDGSTLTFEGIETILTDPTNTAPDAVDDPFTVSEDQDPNALVGNVLTNDDDAETPADLEVSEVDGAPAGVGTPVAGSDGGLITINEDGTVSFDPNGEFDDLAPGEDRTTTVEYTVTDPEGLEDTATVTFTVTGVNDEPDAVDDPFTVTEDQDPTALVGNVLTNDADPDTADAGLLEVSEVDGAPGSVGTPVAGSDGGLITINEDGTVSFDPNDEFDDLPAGEERTTTVEYTVTDPDGLEDTATVTFTVTGVDDEPEAEDDPFTVSEDQDPSAVIGNVLDNDDDAETPADLTVAEVDGSPAGVGTPVPGSNGGLITINEDGTVSFDPNDEFDDLAPGEDRTTTVEYTVTDPSGLEDTATVTFTVTGVNDDPDAVDDSDTTDFETPVEINLLANDTDVDDPTSALTVTSATVPASEGTLTEISEGVYTFTPADGFEGTATVSYTISDGAGGEDSAVHTIVVGDDPNPADGIVDGEEFGEDMAPGYDDADGPTNGGGDIIDGADGIDDTILGNGGDDTIDSGLGDDSVDGGDGDDTFVLTNGLDEDTIIGGEGEETDGDTLDASSLTQDVVLQFTNPEDGRLSSPADLEATTFEEIENVILGSGDDTVIGSTGGDNVNAGAGDDLMQGRGGDDTLVGGSGEDSIDGGDNDDSLDGGDDDDILIGGTGEDTLDGGDGQDTIFAGDDNDTIVGSAGDDVIDGGDGTDTYEGPADETMIVNVDDNGNGTVELVGEGIDDVTSVENYIAPESATEADEITLTTPVLLSEVPTAITGLDDASVGEFTALNGDVIPFGPAEDYDLSDILAGTSPDGVLPAVGPAGDFTITDGDEDGQIGEISFENFETINFSVVDDVSPGTDGPVDGLDDGEEMLPGYTDAQGDQIDGADGDDDTIFGNGGDDTIDSGDGNDVVDGGDGDDTFVLTDGMDEDTIIGGEGDETEGDTLDASDFDTGEGLEVVLTAPETGTITEDATGDTTEFEEIENIITGAGDDTITGSDGNDNVDSGGGDDLMEGGGGNDTLVSGDGEDTIDGGAGNDSLVGGDEADTIIGGTGDDTIDGLRGPDILDGGDGDDSILGGADADTIFAGDDNDTIVGSAGDDVIDGGDGTDTYEGPADETMIVNVDDNGNGTVELVGEGIDDVTSVENYIAPESATEADEITLTTPVLLSEVPTAITGLDDASVGEFTALNGDVIPFGPAEDYDLSDILAGTSPDGVLPAVGPAGDFTITDGDEDGQIGEISFENFETINFSVVDDVSPGTDGPVDGLDDGEEMLPGYTDAQGDQIDGADGDDDTIFGNGGDDTIDSGDGNDVVDGGDGDDTFVLTDGMDEDTIIGGEGDETEGDTLDASDFDTGEGLEVVLTAPETGTITEDATGDTTEFEEIENIITGAGDDTITGSDGNDNVDSGGGDDLMEGGGGNDTLVSGDGEDTIDGGAGDDSLVGGDEADTIIGGTGDDTIDGLRGPDILDGGDGDDSILGGADADTIFAGDDNDTIVGSAGDDVIDGGDGTDTYEGPADETMIVNVDDNGNGTVELVGEGIDDVTSVENYIAPESATEADEITLTTPVLLSEVPTAITGLDDASVGEFTALNGDVIPFGPAEDYDLSDILAGTSPDGVLPAVGPAGDFTITDGDEDGQIGEISFENFETINFSVVDDVSPGTDGPVDGLDDGEEMLPGYTDAQGDQIDGADGDDDTIFGNGGDDTIDSGDGNDVVDGGDGDDTFVLTDGMDEDTIIGGEGDETEGDTLDASDFDTGEGLEVVLTAPETGTITEDATGDTTEFEEIENIITGAGDDTITGSDGNDNVDSGGGDDLMEGGGGNDTLVSGDGEDTIDGGAGNDSLVGGDEADTLIGGEGDDTLDGQSGPDDLDGGEGDDLLLGGEDSDTITGGDGSDVVEDLGGNNVIDTSGGNPLPDIGFPAYGPFPAVPADGDPDDDRDLVTTGSGNDSITTGDDADTIVSGAGNDTIDSGIDDDDVDAGAGADLVTTGEGNDTVLGGDGNDTIYGGLGPSFPSSTDIPDAPGTGTFGPDPVPGNGQDLIDGGRGADVIYGEDDDDTLIGGLGADTLDGGIDDDLLQGGFGQDDMIGGQGADTMEGGDDRDFFIINEREDAFGDVVDGGTGGNDVDRLDLRNLGRFEIVGETVDADLDSTSGTVNFLDDLGGIEGSLTFTEIERLVICFTPGTAIATPRGEMDVAELTTGDRVITRDNGVQEISWVGRKKLGASELIQDPKLRPVLIKKGSLGNNLPERDMMVSPNHRMLMANSQTQVLFDEREVLVAAKYLVGQPGIHQLDSIGVEYVHVMFENHEVILGDGTWTESFQPGDHSLSGIDHEQREEIFKLFPSLQNEKGRRAYSSARQSLKAHEAKMLRDTMGL